MYDYDARYRELRAAGFRGWAGHDFEQGLARLTGTLNRLELEGFLRKPARVLELGCGNGLSSFLLAQKGYEVHGIDLSQTAILWAKERFAAAGLTGSFREGDVRDMPIFADESFDSIIDGSCLHCLIGSDRTRCLKEVRRILRPGGAFVVSSMCGLPKSDEARASFDPQRQYLMKNGEPYRTLKPLTDLAAELACAGFGLKDSWLNTNPWRDHATMICRGMPVDHAEPSAIPQA